MHYWRSEIPFIEFLRLSNFVHITRGQFEIIESRFQQFDLHLNFVKNLDSFMKAIRQLPSTLRIRQRATFDLIFLLKHIVSRPVYKKGRNS